MPQSYCSLLYHIISGTKDGRPWLDTDRAPRVHAYLGGAVRQEGGVALAVGGTQDHVHILAGLRQDKAVSQVVCNIKAVSSGWMHKEWPDFDKFAWQSGYGAFTVSASQVEKIRQYIAGQAKHHAKMSFKEELMRLLKAHGIEFDEEYL